jgi:GTP-binding protein YchF
MGFNCGIVGLPNVGKSTLFNAMTAAHVPAENYPFCTTDHHTGMVAVPDKRLDDIAAIFKPEKLVHTMVEFVDIAGLVKNAHKGEGLGNKFLSYIREVDAIAHVIRCFDAENVSHQYDTIEPLRDIEVVSTELMLADLETVEKRLSKLAPQVKSGEKEAKEQAAALEKIKDALSAGTPARKSGLDEKEWSSLTDLYLLSTKPVMYVCNVNETDVKEPSARVKKVMELAEREHIPVVEICGGIEAELVDLETNEERKAFLDDLGLSESGLERVIHAGYKLLNLVTFFTKDGPEVRAWSVPEGIKAPQAAGKIHTDFEKGFIRAEVYTYYELMAAGDEHKIKDAGNLRIEGHDYIIHDGDIIHFRFNV